MPAAPLDRSSSAVVGQACSTPKDSRLDEGYAAMGIHRTRPGTHIRFDNACKQTYIPLFRDAGWSSLVARRAHNPKVVGSNPAPATRKFKGLEAIASEPFFFLNTLPRPGHHPTRSEIAGADTRFVAFV
jgi:hypothetical protein